MKTQIKIFFYHSTLKRADGAVKLTGTISGRVHRHFYLSCYMLLYTFCEIMKQF